MRCRACQGGLMAALDLGSQPAGGRFTLQGGEPGDRLPFASACAYPADLAAPRPEPARGRRARCPSPLSSQTMSRHARAFVDDLVARGLATDATRILSLASHGGHLASLLAERGPSPTILEATPHLAEPVGSQRDAGRHGRAGQRHRPELAPGSMDLIVDSYLLAHLARPRLAIERLVDALAPGGVIVLEFYYLLSTVEGSQWDAIGHGHPVYLSLSWIVDELESVLASWSSTPSRSPSTAAGYGSSPRPAERWRHGQPGSLRASGLTPALDQAVGLDPLRQALERARHEVVAHLAGARAVLEGSWLATVLGRAITFLNAVGVGPELLSLRRRPLLPPSRAASSLALGLPIRGLDALDQDSPDEVLILTWNLAAEVVGSIAPTVGTKTRFLVAIPRLPLTVGATVILADLWLRPAPACDDGQVPHPDHHGARLTAR